MTEGNDNAEILQGGEGIGAGQRASDAASALAAGPASAPTDTPQLERPLVSVLIPVFNAEAYLRQCLDSVLAQTLTDFEIVCIDDASTDASPAILQEYAAKNPCMRVVCKDHESVGQARNAGLDAARGRYILFVDADDFIEPTMLEKLVAKALEDKADICICGMDLYYQQGDYFKDAPSHLNRKFIPDTLPFSADTAGGIVFNISASSACNKLIRSDFVAGHGLRFPDREMSEDLAFTTAAMGLAEAITLVDEVMYHYRKGTEASTADASVDARCRAGLEALSLARGQIEAVRPFSAEMQRSFANRVVGNARWHFEHATTYKAARDLYDAYISEGGFARLGALDEGRDYYYSKADYELFSALLEDDGLACWLFARTQHLSSKCEKLQETIRQIRSSHSFRVGHALLAPVRKLRGGAS